MTLVEETIEATLDASGQLTLTHQSRLLPGPVHVTIRVAGKGMPHRVLADVIREIAADRRARDFPGRSAADVHDEDESLQREDAERDRELESVRRKAS